MLTFTKPLFLALAILGSSVSAQAVIYTDSDDGLAGFGFRYLQAGSTTNGSYSGQFNLLSAGYDNTTMQVDEAAVYFAFADDYDSDGALEWVSITLASWTSSAIEVDGTIWSYDWIWGSLGGTLLATLSDTGILDFTVTALRGDTYLKEAVVVASASARQVSESASTLALLGLGLLCLGAAHRRLRTR